MNLRMYQVDAFSDHLFGGNPAGVCLLEGWLSDSLMQNIAMENNLAETAFVIKEDDHYHIRWYTPVAEVDLCGHATLASAHVIFQYSGEDRNEIRLSSRSGELNVRKEGSNLILNFPTDTIEKIEIPVEIVAAFRIPPVEAWKGKTDYMLVYDDQAVIESIVPDFNLLIRANARGVIITSRGKEADFVSRFFAPMVGINEDPVTGSAHTTLIPYWSEKLGKTTMNAVQLSKRRGHLHCKYLGNRVEIGGKAVTYLVGNISV